MKYLSDYIQDAQTKLFNETGAFFAFSNKQFNEQKQEGKTYVNCGAGMLCPKENVQSLIDGLDEIAKNGIAQDIKENGKTAIIRRELYNHEAFYTYDIDSTVAALDGYGFTREEIAGVFREVASTIDS
jgi:hypothetical protein